MKMSNSAQYGLMAVGYIATHPTDGNIRADIIAAKYNMPLEFLLKILQYLVRAGILNSKRGPRGGFTMGKPAEEVTLLDIFEAVDGPSMNQVDLIEQTRKAPYASRMEKVCDGAIAKRNEVLRSATLAALVDAKKK
ncbi:MAG: hypothetical protein A2Y12_13405 [Planctomycetes bacterium GWF2_42_9]|nr:MAG: hypothetical protein A2Y12_13405 [Planctomycetes bacterium GWF2_42_9]